MATRQKAPPLVLAVLLSLAGALSGLAAITLLGLADDLRETGLTVTATAISDTQSGGRSSLSRVDVRFTTREGALIETTLEEPAEYLELGDEIEIVYDPDDPSDATAVGDESRTAWIVALVAVVFAVGAMWEWARWANRRWPDSGVHGGGRRNSPTTVSAAEAAAKKERALQRRRKKRKRRGR